MDIRKLEDRKRRARPDRARASWNASQKNPSLENPPKVQETSHEETSQPEVQNSPAPIRRRSGSSPEDKWRCRESPPKGKKKFLILLVPLVVLAAFIINDKTKRESNDALENRERTLTFEEEVAALNFPPAEGDLPLDVADKFLQTSDPLERMKYARDPQRIAQILSSFPEQARSEIPTDTRLFDNFVNEEPGVQRIETVFKDGTYRSLFIVRTPEGPKVDWEAYARWSNALQKWTAEAADPDFQRGEESAVVRVFINIEFYYNFRFSDEEVWKSYRIKSRDLPDSVTAYAKADSVAAKILSTELDTEGKRMTLQLKSLPDDVRRKQFEIEKVLAVGWVIPSQDFETQWLRENAD